MALAGVHVSGRSSPISEYQPLTISNLVDVDSLNTKLNSNILSVLNNPMNEVNQIIFNSQLSQKQWGRVQQSFVEEDCDEEVQLLPSRDRQLPKADPVRLKVCFQCYCCMLHLAFSWYFIIITVQLHLMDIGHMHEVAFKNVVPVCI